MQCFYRPLVICFVDVGNLRGFGLSVLITILLPFFVLFANEL